MIRFTWLQSRTQTTVALVGLLVVAAALAATGPQLVHLYDTTVAPCTTSGDCATARTAFLRTDSVLRLGLGVLVAVVPAILGIFWGAPLVARELESGTYRLAWTQTVSRNRWLAVKLGVVGLSSMVAAGLLSLMVTWWASPLDRADMSVFSTFDQRDLVPVGYAAFAFAIGVTAGIVLRRTVPAMAASLLGFAGARVAVAQWLRPHLATTIHASLPLRSAPGMGFTPSSAGVTFVADKATIPNAWVISSRLVDRTGGMPSARALHQFLQQGCPSIANPPPATGSLTRRPADQAVFQTCISKLSAAYHLSVTYQPAPKYWPLQWAELAVFLGGTLVLCAICFWRIHRGHA